MGKYKYGLMGPVSGKVGPVVSRSWKGKSILQGYNPNVSNPRTEAQQMHRAKFGAINRLSTALNPAIKRGFGFVAMQNQTTERGAFVKKNWSLITATTPADVTIDFDSLQVSDGGFPNVNFGELRFTEGTVTVDFNSNWTSVEISDDEIYLCIYCPQKNESFLSNPVKRHQGHLSCNVPRRMQGQRVHVWGFTVAGLVNTPFSGQASPSLHLGSGSIN